MITVLGKLADTKHFSGQRGYNVSVKFLDWTPEKGKQWIREAFDRGDLFLLVSAELTGVYADEVRLLVELMTGCQ